MNKKIGLLIMFGMLLLIATAPVISSEIFKQDEIVDFKKTCTNSTNTVCSTASSCNVSIVYPNNSYLLDSGVMTNNDKGLFNYSLNSTLTNSLGTHTWDMFCCDGGVCGEAHGNFDITKTGVELTQDKALVYLGLLALLVFLFLITIAGTTILPKGNNKDEQTGLIMSINNIKFIRPILFVLSWALLMAIFFTSSNIAYLYLQTKMMGNLMLNIYKMMMVLSLPMVIVWVVWIFSKIFQDKEIKNMLDRGIQVESTP